MYRQGFGKAQGNSLVFWIYGGRGRLLEIGGEGVYAIGEKAKTGVFARSGRSLQVRDLCERYRGHENRRTKSIARRRAIEGRGVADVWGVGCASCGASGFGVLCGSNGVSEGALSCVCIGIVAMLGALEDGRTGRSRALVAVVAGTFARRVILVDAVSAFFADGVKAAEGERSLAV